MAAFTPQILPATAVAHNWLAQTLCTPAPALEYTVEQQNDSHNLKNSTLGRRNSEYAWWSKRATTDENEK